MELLGLCLIFLALVFYFLPTYIASKREAQHSGAILFINLFFGWTVLGWFAALIWAITEKSEDSTPPPAVVDKVWSEVRYIQDRKDQRDQFIRDRKDGVGGF